ncbi:MAG: nucleotidyltransferase family protein [Acetobacteraceae bacterium]|nr:nucleotidyltransferase family protein [Acetobacteraceae bacterium]
MRGAGGIAAFVEATPALREPLAAVAALALPDAWIGAGFLRNAVWDALHGLPFGANPSGDVDVVWFDPARASVEDDAAQEARLRAHRPGAPWSVRNQARMAGRNGDPPYAGTLDAVAHWPDTATAVAARLVLPVGAVEVAAPWGVDDLLAGVVRPTPGCADNPAKRRAFARRVAEKDWLRRWPGLRVVDSPPRSPA